MYPRLQPCGCNPTCGTYPKCYMSQVRHGDSCIAAEAARTARRCEPLSRYVDAVAPYLVEHGVRTVFLATDSEEVTRMCICMWM